VVARPSSATALGLLTSLAPPRAAAEDDIIAPRGGAARWCGRCGAPRDLGRRDCPGRALLADARARLAADLARHGVPAGGPLELARRAGVPLRVVGERMATAARGPSG